MFEYDRGHSWDFHIVERFTVLRGVRAAGGPHPPDALVLREFFAGKGVITKEWQQNGIALEPIEVYTEPHRRGYREAHH